VLGKGKAGQCVARCDFLIADPDLAGEFILGKIRSKPGRSARKIFCIVQNCEKSQQG
jgi:hypothetical protein